MSAHKKINWTPMQTQQPKKQAPVVNDNAENLIQKAEIDRMKKLLTEKIKDPKLAKKAAMIISEMLNSKTK